MVRIPFIIKDAGSKTCVLLSPAIIIHKTSICDISFVQLNSIAWLEYSDIPA
jgi:hypothetical protein